MKVYIVIPYYSNQDDGVKLNDVKVFNSIQQAQMYVEDEKLSYYDIVESDFENRMVW